MAEIIKDSYVYEDSENGYRADHVRDDHDWDYEQKFRHGEQRDATPDDIEIRDKVCEAIFRDHLVDPSQVTVNVQEGVVTLSGFVSDRKTKDYMEHYLEDIYGVVNVVNQLIVRPDHGLVGDMDWPI